MPDLTMCNGGDCPLRKTCYRYRATPSFWQSYFTAEVYDAEKKTCEYYDEVRESDIIEKERHA